ncbi:MAG: phosphopantetheine-binding protein [Myxococcales bacterium]|nr:phosphopantetheine-binding protein [Myxococcales bacterium]
MDRSQLLTMFLSTAAEVAEREFQGVDEASVISSLGVDSLAMLEIVGEMEKSLEIQIPDDQLVGIETVKNLLDLLERRVQQG